jgi:RNA polymerase sigma-70 factor (ECF subfamily)
MTPEAAFHALVERAHPRLFRLAARITGSAADAEDIVQEAFLRTFRSVQRGALPLDGASEPLMLKVVTHLSLNFLRGHRRAAAREQGFQPIGTNAVDAADARVALRELSELLSQLSPEQRAALVLKELEGLSAKEAAAALGCSEGAVEQRVLRAREVLKARTAA